MTTLNSKSIVSRQRRPIDTRNSLVGSTTIIIMIRRLITRTMSEYNRIWGAGSHQVGGCVMCNDGPWD